jgi:PAS domain S-box-containing protein
MQVEASLRFAVHALQAGLINAGQLADACTHWSEDRSQSLRDVIIERSGLKPADQSRLEQLLDDEKRQKVSDSPTRIVPARATEAGAAATPVPAGETLTDERYVRLHVHASGGMGQVWLARDAQLNREVALKELRAEVASDVPLTQRFIREAQITGQLEHPGIVPVYDFGWNSTTGEPFYTMRFVRGRTMVDASVTYHEKRLQDQADPLELVTLLSAFVAVCNAMAYAHSHRILHRDLKGENILLGDFGEVLVVDWGLAKTLDAEEAALTPGGDWLGQRGSDRTIAGSIIGTPGYMAPEQADGRLDLIDHRTDIYGLGAILYEVLTGRPPSSAETATEAIQQALRGDFARPRDIWPEVPPALEAVCLRALARDPNARFQSATDLGQEVQRWQDVQRRAAENALQRQSEILQSILDSMGEGVIVTDEAGRILQINPAAESIFGVHPAGKELQLAPGYEIFLPDQVTRCPADQLPLVRAIQGEEMDDAEYFVRVPDRPEGLWASASARPLKDNRGRVRGGLVVIRDISERKRAEEELRRSRERFDLAVQGSQDGLWDWDLETNAIYYSPRWKSIIGYEDHEIAPALGEWESRLHPDEKERVLAANFAHIDGTTPHYEYEYRLRHKDGSYRWILARGAALRNASGKAYRMAGSHVDVTSRREAEQALKESEQRYNAVIAALPVPVTVIGADGRLFACNPSAQKILGVVPDLLAGRSVFSQDWNAVHEDGRPFAPESFPAAISLRTGRPVQDVVMGLPTTNGGLRWISINAQPVFREPGSVPYAVVTAFADITELKALKEAVRQA